MIEIAKALSLILFMLGGTVLSLCMLSVAVIASWNLIKLGLKF